MKALGLPLLVWALGVALAAQAPRLEQGLAAPVGAAVADDPELAQVLAPFAAEVVAIIKEAIQHKGVDGLVAALSEARFPILNCNFNPKGAPALASRLLPWMTKELGGIKVGLTGVGVEFKDLVSPDNHRGVAWRDPVEALKPVVRQLREVERVDLVVLLSHLGFDRQGDAILEAPVRVAQAGGETDIFQVGCAGVNLGRMDVAVRRGVKVAASGLPIPVLG